MFKARLQSRIKSLLFPGFTPSSHPIASGSAEHPAALSWESLPLLSPELIHWGITHQQEAVFLPVSTSASRHSTRSHHLACFPLLPPHLHFPHLDSTRQQPWMLCSTALRSHKHFMT